MTETLWLHGTPPSDPVAICELIETLEQNRPGLKVVVTGDACPEIRRHTPGPGSNRLSQKAFLEALQPDAVVFAGRLDPTLAQLKCHAIWLDATLPQPPRWPRLTRPRGIAIGESIHHILTAPGLDAQRLVSERSVASRLETPGLLRPSTRPLPYDVRARDEMAQHLAGRPVWMASFPAPVEVPHLLEAHRVALSQSHRLLLVLAIPPQSGDAIAGELQAQGWHTARRSAKELPGPEVQLLIADIPSELGLWYRLAPLTFLGGTLAGGPPTRPPFEAAALGSALLHGPEPGPYADEFENLARANAARRIELPETLSRAVGRLLSADVAANLATAAWDVVTAGAPAMNRAVTLIERLLDREPGAGR